MALAIAYSLPVDELPAQQLAHRWQPAVEVGAAAGSRYLDGTNAPIVDGGVGFFAGASLTRNLTPRTDGGARLRVLSQPVELTELGATWDGGRVLDVSALATLSLHPATSSRFYMSIDFAAGGAFLSGAKDVVPFRGSSFAPAAEVGTSIHRRSGESYRGRQSLNARWNVIRLTPDASELETAAGFASRILVSLQVAW